MCDPVSFRIFESAITCSRSLDTTAGRDTGAGAGAGAVTTGAGAVTTGAGAATVGVVLSPLRSMWSSTSSRVILPPGPLPTSASTSIPCSATNLRTTGDSNLLEVATGTGTATTGAAIGAGAAAATTGAATTGAGAGAAATTGAGAGAGAGAEPATPTTAITVPTGTVSPSATRISVRVPEIGDGTSVSTLSVDTSKSGSSAATVSPTFLNQRVMVPSVTVSPSCGSVISAMILL